METGKSYRENHDVIEKIFVGNNIEINELIQLLEKHRTGATDYKEVTVYFSSEKDGDVSINLECEK